MGALAMGKELWKAKTTDGLEWGCCRAHCVLRKHTHRLGFWGGTLEGKDDGAGWGCCKALWVFGSSEELWKAYTAGWPRIRML